MDAEQRQILKVLVDQKVRENTVSRIYRSCDPEDLTISADEAEELGYTEIASALRHFRDNVVNVLFAEGWSLDRIERAAFRAMGVKQ